MSKSTPSLLALLGLVAVAGYQNRSRISDMLSDARQNDQTPRSDALNNGRADGGMSSDQDGGFLAQIGRMFQVGTGGASLSNGLSDLVEKFKSAGRTDSAESWVSNGPNKPVDVDDLGNVLGEETLADLGRKTGMTREQLLLRLNAALPDVVNQFTPNGRIPTETEAGAY